MMEGGAAGRRRFIPFLPIYFWRTILGDCGFGRLLVFPSDKMGTGIQNRTRDDRIEQLEEFVIPRFSRLGEFFDGKKKDKIGMVK